MEVFTAFFSTNGTGNSAPIQVPAAANNYVGIWAVNWDSLFNSRKYGQCRVKFDFRSNSFAVGAETNNTLSGSLRTDLSSQHSSVTNGVCLGLVNPSNDVITGANHLIIGNTLETGGVTINIPTYSNTLTVRLVQADGFTPIPLTAGYQLVLCFEADAKNLNSEIGSDKLSSGRPY